MPNYYRLADLVVVPSQVEEAFCMVAVEAIAAGKPVLSGQQGGISEFVLEIITAAIYFAETMTSESIIADVKIFLADTDRAQIAKNARNFVFSKYSWEHVTQRFEAQIQDWFG